MIRRWCAGALGLHAAYAAAWLLLSDHARAVFERWATLAGMAVAGAFYAGMVVAFVWARKSRLNLAFAVQKLYWAALVWLVAFPLQAGLLVHHAPYRRVVNPYALWVAPGWLRTYLWLAMAVSTVGVASEFWRANWGPGRPPGGEPDTVVAERPSAWPAVARVAAEVERVKREGRG